MAKPTIKSRAEISNINQKHGWLAKSNGTNKHVKKIRVLQFLSHFWSCFNYKQKIFSSHDFSLHSLIFLIFIYLLIFLLRYWPRGFFLWNQIFWFSFITFNKLGSFLLLNLLSFIRYFYLKFWGFFLNNFRAIALVIVTYLLEFIF